MEASTSMTNKKTEMVPELDLISSLDAGKRPENKEEDEEEEEEQEHEEGNLRRRYYSCSHCPKTFYSSQALGGHQNAHKQEKLLARRCAFRPALLRLRPPLHGVQKQLMVRRPPPVNLGMHVLLHGMHGWRRWHASAMRFDAPAPATVAVAGGGGVTDGQEEVDKVDLTLKLWF